MTEPDLRNIIGDGQNKDCEPMEVIWQEDYSMMVPVCPKCKELAYENEYCVFCGQPFKVHIPTEEEKKQAFEEQKKKIKGATWNEEKQFFACDGCGEDINKTCSMVGFYDGIDGGGMTYACKCGKSVYVGH